MNLWWERFLNNCLMGIPLEFPYFILICYNSKCQTLESNFHPFFKSSWIPKPRWGFRNSTLDDGFWKITNSSYINLLNSNKRTSPKLELATDDPNSECTGPLAQLKETLILSNICHQWEEDLHFSPIIIIVIKDNAYRQHSNLDFLCSFPCGVPFFNRILINNEDINKLAMEA